MLLGVVWLIMANGVYKCFDGIGLGLDVGCELEVMEGGGGLGADGGEAGFFVGEQLGVDLLEEVANGGGAGEGDPVDLVLLECGNELVGGGSGVDDGGVSGDIGDEGLAVLEH